MSRYIAILAATMIATVTACSYVVDMVERSITKRASFSITATYDSVAHTVTINWTEAPGSNFAGYEVYMSENPDDEYSGYVIIAGPDNLGSDISSELFYDDAATELNSSDTRSYTYPDNFLSNKLTADDVTASGRTARYFFRLGIIDWDQNPDKRPERYIGNALWNVGANLFENYKIHTDIEEISGSAMVDITRW